MTPALNFPPELLLQAQGIKLVFFDVDGVLTDGGLYFGETGETIKRFHTLDGHGLKLLQRTGIVPAVITAAIRKPCVCDWRHWALNMCTMGKKTSSRLLRKR